MHTTLTRAATTTLAAILLAAASTEAGAQVRGGADEARPISLEEAVRLAQRNAPAAVQARGQIRTARAAVTSSYGAFLPNFNVSTGISRSSGSRFDTQRDQVLPSTTSWQYSNGYSAGVQLFDGGDRFFALREARMNEDAAAAGDVSQRFTVRLSVAQQYYNVLAARESESAARAQLEQAEQQFRVASARVAAGAATRSDSLRSVIQVGNARLALVQAQNAVNSGSAALTRLVAAPFPVTAMVADTASPVVASLPDSAALARLAESGPAVDQAAAQYSAARAGLRSSWTAYLPTIGLNYTRGGNAPVEGFDIFPSQVAYANSLRFSLNFPLFNNYTREEQRVRADVAEDVAQAQFRDARLLAQQTLVQNIGTLRTARERISIQLASVEAAEEDLRVQQQRYTLGASTLLDVLTSQTQLDQARAQLIQARYDFRVARAQIEALIGQPLP